MGKFKARCGWMGTSGAPIQALAFADPNGRCVGYGPAGGGAPRSDLLGTHLCVQRRSEHRAGGEG